MSIWNKILIGLNIVAALVFLFFAMRALKTHQHWRDSVRQHEVKLAALAEEKDQLINGSESQPGIRQWQLAVHRFTVGRGRVWPNAMPQRVDPAAGDVVVACPLSPPENAIGTQLYLFANPTPAQAGAYLGEFTIRSVTNQWALRASRPLSPERQAAIKQSRGPWTMYQVLPSVRPDLLADGKAAEAAPGTAPEASPSDAGAALEPAQLSLDAYLQKLVDFEALFRQYYDYQALKNDEIAGLTADVDVTNRACDLADQRIKVLTRDIGADKALLAKTEAARDAVIAHQKAVEGKLAELEGTLDSTLKDNQAKASAWL